MFMTFESPIVGSSVLHAYISSRKPHFRERGRHSTGATPRKWRSTNAFRCSINLKPFRNSNVYPS
jgi:hypothetical protein